MKDEICIKKGLSDAEAIKHIYNLYGGDSESNTFDVLEKDICILKRTPFGASDLISYEIKRQPKRPKPKVENQLKTFKQQLISEEKK